MLIKSSRIHNGRVITVDVDEVEFPNGTRGRLDMIRHPGAAAVVPMLDGLSDPDPRILLIRQFRHAADGYIWEIPAGTLSPGEEPRACAHRELIEKAGYRAATLTELTAIFTAPGFTDESIHLFLATDLTPTRAAPEADEFITVHEFRWSAVGRMIRRREILDAKSLTALMFVQSFLRA